MRLTVQSDDGSIAYIALARAFRLAARMSTFRRRGGARAPDASGSLTLRGALLSEMVRDTAPDVVGCTTS